MWANRHQTYHQHENHNKNVSGAETHGKKRRKSRKIFLKIKKKGACRVRLHLLAGDCANVPIEGSRGEFSSLTLSGGPIYLKGKREVVPVPN
jgi:hypothetical protein